MGASSNFGNMFSVVGGAYFLPFLPMAPIQVLVNNLLYDLSQTGIPLDQVDREYLDKPRRWNIRSIQSFMVFIGPISSIFDYATFFLMLYFFGCADLGLAAPAALRGFFPQAAAPDATYAAALFHTGWLVESLLTQTLIVHIIRTQRIPFLQSRPSKAMGFTTLAVMAIGVWLPYSPIAHYLGLVPLPPVFFLWLAGFLLAYSAITHVVKMWFARRFGAD
jgi:Mg2+-importing ATPase